MTGWLKQVVSQLSCANSFPEASIMEFIAISRRHLDDGNTRAAVETALEACKHNGHARAGQDGEPPDLRDARINLIMKVLDCARTAMSNEEFRVFQALLDRRIFNFLQRGDDLAECKRFPWLFPYEQCVFDGGRDRPLPVFLDEYIHFMLWREDAWLSQNERKVWSAWMIEQSAAVKTEIQRRRLPIGTAVRACGLKNAPDLNGCRGVVVGFQQRRFQIEFDQIDKEPRALLPANLEADRVNEADGADEAD